MARELGNGCFSTTGRLNLASSHTMPCTWATGGYLLRHLSSQNSCLLGVLLCCAFRQESMHCFFIPCKCTCPFFILRTWLPSSFSCSLHRSFITPPKPSLKAALLVAKSLSIALLIPLVFCPGLAKSDRRALDEIHVLSICFLISKMGW